MLLLGQAYSNTGLKCFLRWAELVLVLYPYFLYKQSTHFEAFAIKTDAVLNEHFGTVLWL